MFRYFTICSAITAALSIAAGAQPEQTNRFANDGQCARLTERVQILLKDNCKDGLFTHLQDANSEPVPIVQRRGGFQFGSIEGVWDLVAYGDFWRDELDEEAFAETFKEYLRIEADDQNGIRIGSSDSMSLLSSSRKTPSRMGQYSPRAKRFPRGKWQSADGHLVRFEMARCRDPQTYSTAYYKPDCLILHVKKRVGSEWDYFNYPLVFFRKQTEQAALQ